MPKGHPWYCAFQPGDKRGKQHLLHTGHGRVRRPSRLIDRKVSGTSASFVPDTPARLSDSRFLNKPPRRRAASRRQPRRAKTHESPPARAAVRDRRALLVCVGSKATAPIVALPPGAIRACPARSLPWITSKPASNLPCHWDWFQRLRQPSLSLARMHVACSPPSGATNCWGIDRRNRSSRVRRSSPRIRFSSLTMPVGSTESSARQRAFQTRDSVLVPTFLEPSESKWGRKQPIDRNWVEIPCFLPFLTINWVLVPQVQESNNLILICNRFSFRFSRHAMRRSHDRTCAVSARGRFPPRFSPQIVQRVPCKKSLCAARNCALRLGRT